MKLKEKGPIVKPPILKSWAQKASIEIQSWKGVVSATHWRLGDPTQVDGADFYVGEKELGHIHLDGEMHVKLTQGLRDALVTAKLAQAFRWGDDWVQFSVEDRTTLESGLWLFRFAYDRLNGKKAAELGLEIKNRLEMHPE